MYRFKARHRRALLVVPMVLAAVMAVAMSAFAVHDFKFQLDGDTLSTPTTTVDGVVQTIDWNDLFDAAGDERTLPVLPGTNPDVFDASGFDQDFTNNGGSFGTNDDTTFATGSKDTLPISPGWQCNRDSNVNSKIDIMNAYAASYTATQGTATKTDDHEILYFGLERNANTGDANVAFWFLQDGVNCVSPGGSTPFTGSHRDGDILVVSAFSNGGGVSTIDAYRWDDPDGAGVNPGSLRTTPVGSGGDCQTASGDDEICGTTNSEANGDGDVTVPWDTANKQDGVGHRLRQVEFFEGGIDLTETGLGGKCFNVFLANTRSSTSLTATLFDFSRGQLGQCSSSTVTTPMNGDGTTPFGASQEIPANAQLSVKDSALVTVSGVDVFSGSVTFHLCGPTDPTLPVAGALCTSGGVAAGSANVTSSPSTVTSNAMTVTKVGRYCWRATFSGDANAGVPGSSDSRASECFIVTPKTPTVSTSAAAATIDFGQSTSDTATLGGTANRPGSDGPTGSDGSINPTVAGTTARGTIQFTLYNEDCTAAATVSSGTNPHTVNVTNGNGQYVSSSVTPAAPGTYHWVAVYSGDSPNTNASATPTATQCQNDAAETVVVRQIPSEITTRPKAYPQDSATITSSVAGNNLPANGTVVFRLYEAGGGNTALQNCQAGGDTVGQGGLIYRDSQSTGAAANSVTLTTNNTTVAVDNTASATYYWLVTYAVPTGHTAHTGRKSDCAENMVVSFTRDAGPGSVFP